MCMILDNNTWGDFLKNKPDMQPIHKWLEKTGKLIYSNHIEFKELSPKYIRNLQEYKRKKKAELISSEIVKKGIEEIQKEIKKKSQKIQSNDIHILGLAKVKNIKLLCTKDKDLHKDFKKIIKGNIYQNKNHQKLLTKDTCP